MVEDYIDRSAYFVIFTYMRQLQNREFMNIAESEKRGSEGRIFGLRDGIAAAALALTMAGCTTAPLDAGEWDQTRVIG